MSHVDDGTLHAYLDGELAPPEAQGVEAHVAQCPACRERLEEERALIARATELLARAAPPDRDLPPFRPGDLKPPVRLWWQVRLPLAWAATIALALGIGTYVGERRTARREQTPSAPDRLSDVAGRIAANAPAAATAVRDSAGVEERQRRDERRAAAARPAPPRPPEAAGEEKPQAELSLQARVDTIRIRASNAIGMVRESTPLVVDGQPKAAPAPAAAPEPARPEMAKLRGFRIARDPIGVDSARLLLGREPLVVPDVPIRAIYRGRMIGYSGVVIIEQALDSATVIEVINGRPAPVQLDAVVTGGAAGQPDSSAARAMLNPPVADSFEAASRAMPAAKKMGKKAERASPDLFVDVRGPIPADSLAALRRLLRPLRR